MAAIDKIFARTKDEFLEFYNWCNKFRKLCRKEIGEDIMAYFYITPDSYDEDSRRYSDGLVPITNFPTSIDQWLAKHCPVRWVRERYDYIGNGCKATDLVLYVDTPTKQIPTECKHYYRGKCYSAYQIHGAGLNFHSRKHAWMWRCLFRNRPCFCGNYESKELKDGK